MSTISYLVPRLYDATGGVVRIDGIDVSTIALESLASIVSMVTQESYLFHDTISHNLLYAKPHATDAELQNAARQALIHDRTMELDRSCDTVVGERGYRLSGGEKQRLAIVRVILRGTAHTHSSIVIIDARSGNKPSASTA